MTNCPTHTPRKLLVMYANSMSVLSSMDRFMGSCNIHRWSMWLREIHDTRLFRVSKPHGAPISIISYDDLVGSHYDHVWVMGASSTNFPRPVAVNPFIPLESQVNCGIPFSSPEVCMNQASKWLGNIVIDDDKELIFSVGEVCDDGRVNLLSQLISSASTVTDAYFDNPSHEKIDLYQRVNDIVPAMSKAEINSLGGGVSLFSDFFAQPIYTFFKHRLKLRPLPHLAVGLSAFDQGVITHEALRNFWETIKTSERLKRLTNEELNEKIILSVVSALKNMPSAFRYRHSDAVLMMEKRRQVSLVEDWIDLEKNRIEPFEVIATEKESQLDVFGIPLTVRIDRIDKVFGSATEKIVILDYKTGRNVDMKGMNSDSLIEPQLPLYTLSQDACNGVSLAHVSLNRSRYHMRSDWVYNFVKTRAPNHCVSSSVAWESQKKAWSQSFRLASSSICSGDFSINYSKSLYERKYREYLPLLRSL